jgi:hypothetical protein
VGRHQQQHLEEESMVLILFFRRLLQLAEAMAATLMVMQAAAAAAAVGLDRLAQLQERAALATPHLHHLVKATMAAQLAVKTTVLAAAAVLVL